MAKITYVDGDVLDHLFSENCKVTTERIDDIHWLVQIYEPDGSVVSLDFFTFDKPIVSTDRDAELHVHPTEAGGADVVVENSDWLNEPICANCGHSESFHQTAGGFCKHCPCNEFVESQNSPRLGG